MTSMSMQEWYTSWLGDIHSSVLMRNFENLVLHEKNVTVKVMGFSCSKRENHLTKKQWAEIHWKCSSQKLLEKLATFINTYNVFVCNDLLTDCYQIMLMPPDYAHLGDLTLSTDRKTKVTRLLLVRWFSRFEHENPITFTVRVLSCNVEKKDVNDILKGKQWCNPLKNIQLLLVK